MPMLDTSQVSSFPLCTMRNRSANDGQLSISSDCRRRGGQRASRGIGSDGNPGTCSIASGSLGETALINALLMTCRIGSDPLISVTLYFLSNSRLHSSGVIVGDFAVNGMRTMPMPNTYRQYSYTDKATREDGPHDVNCGRCVRYRQRILTTGSDSAFLHSRARSDRSRPQSGGRCL